MPDISLLFDKLDQLKELAPTGFFLRRDPNYDDSGGVSAYVRKKGLLHELDDNIARVTIFFDHENQIQVKVQLFPPHNTDLAKKLEALGPVERKENDEKDYDQIIPPPSQLPPEYDS